MLNIDEIAVIVENKSQERRFIEACRDRGIQRIDKKRVNRFHYRYFKIVENQTISFVFFSKEDVITNKLFPITLGEFVDEYIYKESNNETSS